MSNYTKENERSVYVLNQSSVPRDLGDIATHITLIDADGDPVDIGGGSVHISSDQITDATTTGKAVLTAGSKSDARDAIGAGTSSLTLGTTASTALAGDYKPAWGDVTGKPSFGTAAQADTGDFATSAQGDKADSAVQPADLSPYAKTADLALSGASVAANVATGSTVDDVIAALIAAGLMASA